MRMTRLWDALIGAGFALAGAAVFLTTLGFPRQDDGAPGPALFPRVLAVLMIVFGASLTVSRLAGRGAAAAGESAAGPAVARQGTVNALLVFAAIVFFMVASAPLGFLITGGLILAGLMWRLGAPLVQAVPVSVGVTLFIYVIFGKILRVPLPLGLLWF